MSNDKTKAISKEMKELMLDLERIIGNNCYNGNMQNYGPYGEWEGEGRYFRYPIVYKDHEGTDFKVRMYINYYLERIKESDVILTGSYKFGANSLGIMEGIYEILMKIENRYGISFDKLEKEFQEKTNKKEE